MPWGFITVRCWCEGFVFTEAHFHQKNRTVSVSTGTLPFATVIVVAGELHHRAEVAEPSLKMQQIFPSLTADFPVCSGTARSLKTRFTDYHIRTDN